MRQLGGIRAGPGESGWFWGEKSFYDQDSPMATADQVLEFEPAVVYSG
ncbi:MAG: hypothetical protein ABIJ48_05465 [Actinomycetota bacterium]